MIAQNKGMKAVWVAAMLVMALSSGMTLAADQNTKMDDLWIKGALATTYTLNSQLNPFDIDTKVNNGVVTLHGKVESQVEKDLAEQLALGVDGVTKVDNQLEVGAASPKPDRQENRFAQLVSDADITAKVKSQLLWNQSTHGLQINVDTDNGVVTLKGKVDSEAEAQLAQQIAKNTENVRSVQSQLKVTGQSASLGSKLEKQAKTAGDEISDSWITAKVKSALLYNRDVDMSAFEVDTEQGVVHLKGKVDSDAKKNEAIGIAKGIRGVKQVESDIEVVH